LRISRKIGLWLLSSSRASLINEAICCVDHLPQPAHVLHVNEIAVRYVCVIPDFLEQHCARNHLRSERITALYLKSGIRAKLTNREKRAWA
jgi:hypothetical protein